MRSVEFCFRGQNALNVQTTAGLVRHKASSLSNLPPSITRMRRCSVNPSIIYLCIVFNKTLAVSPILVADLSFASPGILFQTWPEIPTDSTSCAVPSTRMSFIFSSTTVPIVETIGPTYGISEAAIRRTLTANSVPAPMSKVVDSCRLIYSKRESSDE
jgi:hypothetical protein